MDIETVAAALLGVVVASLVGSFARPLGDAMDLLDHPDGARKHHPRATPLTGGLALLAALVASFALYLFLDLPVGLEDGAAVLAVSFCALLGIFDDRKHIPALRRLLVTMLALGLLIVIFPTFTVRLLHSGMFGFQLGLSVLAVPLTILALIALQNALNMVDGIDGLLIGLSLIWLGLMLPWAFDYRPEILPFMALMIGALAALLAFNFSGRLFLGDSGSYLLATLLGLLSIELHNSAQGAMPSELVALWFGLPVADLTRVMVERSRAGSHPFSPDRRHLHHLLLRRFGPRGAVVIYWVAVGLPALIATWLPEILLPVSLLVAVLYIGFLYSHQRRTVET